MELRNQYDSTSPTDDRQPPPPRHHHPRTRNDDEDPAYPLAPQQYPTTTTTTTTIPTPNPLPGLLTSPPTTARQEGRGGRGTPSPERQEPRLVMVAVWDHPSSAEDELSLVPGDVITVMEQPDEGWWVGELHSKVGLFPVAFCREALPEELTSHDPSPAPEYYEGGQGEGSEFEPFQHRSISSSINPSSLAPDLDPTSRPLPSPLGDYHSSSPGVPTTVVEDETDTNLSYQTFHQLYLGGEPELDSFLDDSQLTVDEGARRSQSLTRSDSPLLAGLDWDQVPTLDLGREGPNPHHPNPDRYQPEPTYESYHEPYQEPPQEPYQDPHQGRHQEAYHEPYHEPYQEPPQGSHQDPDQERHQEAYHEPYQEEDPGLTIPDSNERFEHDSYYSSSDESQSHKESTAPNTSEGPPTKSVTSPPRFHRDLADLERRSVLLENEYAENISRRISEDEEKVVKEGILSIKAVQCTSGLLSSTKHWKQYWVVIKASALLVYKHHPKLKKFKPEAKEPPKFKGWFDLTGATATPAAKGQSKKRFVICLTSSDSQATGLFQTEDDASYQSWLRTLQSTIHGHPPAHPVASFITALPRLATEGISPPRKSQLRVPKPPSKKDKDKEGSDPSQSKRSSTKPKSKMMGKLFHRPPAGSPGSDPKTNTGSDSVWYTLAADSDCISYVVKRCVEELEARDCLTSEGIYRLSGNAASIKAWKAKFISIGPVTLATEPDINVITGVLKLFFRELTEPLFPFEAYDDIVNAGRIADYDDRLWAMKDLIHSQLDAISLTTLRCLILHLAAVADQCDVNLMAAQNLAIVFGPTLARPRDPTVHPQLEPLFLLVESLILQHAWFFDTTTPPDSTTY